MTIDPYVYPGTKVLKNKLNIRNAETLERVELELTYARAQLPLPTGHFDYNHLKAIHHHYFSCLYEWAGQERIVEISKGGDLFALPDRIEPYINKIFHSLAEESYLCQLNFHHFSERAAYFFNEINAVHPFREGNGRTLRAFFDQLAIQAHYELDWSKVNREFYIEASVQGFQGEHALMEQVFSQIAEPIKQLQSLQHPLTAETEAVLINYLEKQNQLTELVRQKNHSLVDDPILAKDLGQQAMLLNAELKNMAKELVTNPEAQYLLNQPQLTSLQKQGGFAVIYERYQKNEMSLQDVSVVLRYAKGQVTSHSQFQSKTHEKSKGGRHL